MKELFSRFRRWLRETGLRLKENSPKYFKKIEKWGYALATSGFLVNVFPMSEGFQEVFLVIGGLGAGMIFVGRLPVENTHELGQKIYEKQMKDKMKVQ